MPYYKRPCELWNTLISFEHFYGQRDDFEVIIGEDVKNTPKDFKLLQKIYNRFEKSINIIKVKGGTLDYYNCVLLQNECIRQSNGKYVILSSADIFHNSNILEEFDKYVTKNRVLICNVERIAWCSSSNKVFIDNFDQFKYEHYIWIKNLEQKLLIDDGISGQHRWTEHYYYNPRRASFCTLLEKQDYWDIGGMNEKLAYGYAYDDTDFNARVWQSDLIIFRLPNTHVMHQPHKKPLMSLSKTEHFSKNKEIFWEELSGKYHDSMRKKNIRKDSSSETWANRTLIFIYSDIEELNKHINRIEPSAWVLPYEIISSDIKQEAKKLNFFSEKYWKYPGEKFKSKNIFLFQTNFFNQINIKNDLKNKGLQIVNAIS